MKSNVKKAIINGNEDKQLEMQHAFNEENMIPDFLKSNRIMKYRLHNYKFFNRGIYDKEE